MPMDVTMSETQFAPAGWKEGHAANPWPALASQGRGHSSDEQLAHAAGRGDMAAFDALYQRHHQPLLAFARHMLGRMHDAEDVVQHTFLAADRAFRAGKGPRAVRAWLYTVARRRFVDESRRLSREKRVVSMPEARSSSDYGPFVAGALREALGALPGGQSQVVVLKLLRGMTFAEIGAEVGLTEAAAKMRFRRALEALREELTERGIEP